MCSESPSFQIQGVGCTMTFFQAGSHVVTVSYTGDPNYATLVANFTVKVTERIK